MTTISLEQHIEEVSALKNEVKFLNEQLEWFKRQLFRILESDNIFYDETPIEKSLGHARKKNDCVYDKKKRSQLLIA